MRINKYIAQATGISRRAADGYIQAGRVTVNGRTANLGDAVEATDSVQLDDRLLTAKIETVTILMNKPVGYVCSRNGQGSKTVYDLLPPQFHGLKPVGRLDKDSSGLLLLTNNGELAHQLTHPSFQKQKDYEVTLNKALTKQDQEAIQKGVQLDDGLSKLGLKGSQVNWHITMSEGRNRQIRRTFEALYYRITKLHRTQFGDYKLDDLEPSSYRQVG